MHTEEGKKAINCQHTLLMRNMTGLCPPPMPHTLSKRARPCFMLRRSFARFKARLKGEKGREVEEKEGEVEGGEEGRGGRRREGEGEEGSNSGKDKLG